MPIGFIFHLCYLVGVPETFESMLMMFSGEGCWRLALMFSRVGAGHVCPVSMLAMKFAFEANLPVIPAWSAIVCVVWQSPVTGAGPGKMWCWGQSLGLMVIWPCADALSMHLMCKSFSSANGVNIMSSEAWDLLCRSALALGLVDLDMWHVP